MRVWCGLIVVQAAVTAAAFVQSSHGGLTPPISRFKLSNAVKLGSKTTLHSLVGTGGGTPGKEPDVWWVDLLNKSLDNNTVATLVAFVVVDMGSALVLWRIITMMKIQVCF